MSEARNQAAVLALLSPPGEDESSAARSGTLAAAACEADAPAHLGFAQHLAAALGVPCHALVAGVGAEAAAGWLARSFELSSSWWHEVAGGAREAPAQRVAVLAGVAQAVHASWMVLPHSYGSLDVLPLLAFRVGGATLTEVVAFEGDERELLLIRPLHQGKILGVCRPANAARLVLTAAPERDRYAPMRGGAARIAAAEGVVVLPPPDRHRQEVERPPAGSGVDLKRARRIVAVGRGLGNPAELPKVTELARRLDAAIAGSRPVIDSGWLPRPHQVGSSGETVAPDLYLALGISGSSQHLAGLSNARTIVAVNTDRQAPIFGVARYGIAADLHQVVAALLERLRHEAGEG